MFIDFTHTDFEIGRNINKLKNWSFLIMAQTFNLFETGQNIYGIKSTFLYTCKEEKQPQVSIELETLRSRL